MKDKPINLLDSQKKNVDRLFLIDVFPRIPRAEHVFYETSSKTVSFNVVNYPLGLVAKIELENPDTTYRPHSKLGMADRTFGQMEVRDQVNWKKGLRGGGVNSPVWNLSKIATHFSATYFAFSILSPFF